MAAPANPTPETKPSASPDATTQQPVAESPLLTQAVPQVQAGGVIRGTIRAGAANANPDKAESEKAAKNAVPLPGVSVTATNALTGDKYTTVTDASGAYAMAIPKDGRYVVRSELAAFAAGTKSILLNATNREARVDLNMELASRVPQTQETIAGAGAMGMNARGTQALSLLGSNAGAMSAGVGGAQASLPSASGADTGSDSVSVTGASGSTSAAFNFEAARQSFEDQRALQGSTEARGQGGSGGGGPGGGGFGFLMGGRPPGVGGAGAFRRLAGVSADELGAERAEF
jgi:hypothetical protein